MWKQEQVIIVTIGRSSTGVVSKCLPYIINPCPLHTYNSLYTEIGNPEHLPGSWKLPQHTTECFHRSMTSLEH